MTDPSPAKLLSDLEEARRYARALEGTAYAEGARVFADALERAVGVIEALDLRPSDEWLRPHQIAARLGYVNEDGTPNVDAFRHAAKTSGMPRHRIDGRTTLYNWREVSEFLAGLPG